MSYSNWQFDQFNHQEESPFSRYIMLDTYQTFNPSWYNDYYTNPYRDASPISSSSSCSNTPEIIPLLYQQQQQQQQQHNMLPLLMEKPETSYSNIVSDLSQPEFQQRHKYQPFCFQSDEIQEIPRSYILQTNCFYMNQKILSNNEKDKKEEKEEKKKDSSNSEVKMIDKAKVIPCIKSTTKKATTTTTTVKRFSTKPSTKSKAKTNNSNISNVTGPFPCTFKGCEKQFLRPYNLKSHMRTHTSERPYSCLYPDCEWRFARPHDLKRHQLQHTGLKPHSCKSCNRRFARSDALKRHLKVDATCAQSLLKK